MTVKEILDLVDETKPNAYSEGVKINWLNTLDGRVFIEVIKLREVKEDKIITEFVPYKEGIDEDKQLLITEPFTDVYVYYMGAMIDYTNGETDRYINSMVMFNSIYDDFAAWYRRSHLPRHETYIGGVV